MIDLVILSSVSFQLNYGSSSAVLPRAYDAMINRANHIILRHVKTPETIDLGELSNITINGSSTTFEDIRKLVFNSSCICDDSGEVPNFKIFDFTFDNTFD